MEQRNEPTTGEYTPDELIGAVRWCWINHENSGCYGCPLEHKPCDGLENALADCLERLNMENVDLCIDCGAMTETIASCRDTIESQAHTIAELTARAESAERERDAAIADMKLIVDAVREEHCDETCCFACKFDCDTSINDSGEYGSECPGFDKDDCFEWRGLPQEGDVE